LAIEASFTEPVSTSSMPVDSILLEARIAVSLILDQSPSGKSLVFPILGGEQILSPELPKT